MFGGRARKRVKIGPELDWLSDDNRVGLPMERTSAPQPSATAQPRLPRASANVGTGVPIGSRHQAIQAANDNLVRPVQLHGDLLNSLSEEQDSSSFADSRGPRKA